MFTMFRSFHVDRRNDKLITSENNPENNNLYLSKKINRSSKHRGCQCSPVTMQLLRRPRSCGCSPCLDFCISCRPSNHCQCLLVTLLTVFLQRLYRRRLCMQSYSDNFSALHCHCNVGRSMHFQRRFSTVLKTHWLGSSMSISTLVCSFECDFRTSSEDFLRVFFLLSHNYLFLCFRLLVMFAYHFTVENLFGCNRLNPLGV